MLRCPATGQPLSRLQGQLVAADGIHRYPLAGGVPILVTDDEGEIFRLSEYERQLAAGRDGRRRGLRARAERALRQIADLPPTMSHNVGTGRNLHRFATLLQRFADPQRRPVVLVVGGAVEGVDFDELIASGAVDLVETDVALGPRTQVICDGHRLPFVDGAFDGVVIQGVLGNVADPWRVVGEIHRVLRPGGLVYSEVAFVQQVCMGANEFTRFTLLGHRRLYRRFTEIDSGVHCGPAMALGWSLRYFLMTFSGRSKLVHAGIRRLASLLFFWIKYFDELLVGRPGAVDAASATYFLGARNDRAVSDREILNGYRGKVTTPRQLV